MKEKGLRGKRRRPYRTTTDSRHAVNIAPNLVARDFTAQRPNEVWVTDVTAVFTGAGWLYLAAILDLFSRAVVGWATSSTNDTELALEALEQAVRQRRPPVGLVHHSDRGSPYASHDYVARLKQLGMVASMSRKGDCWDNAVAESFFASLKGEHLDHDWYPAPAAAHGAIADYVDSFYNPQRRHSTLGYFSPNEFELRAHVARLAAQQNRPRNRVNSSPQRDRNLWFGSLWFIGGGRCCRHEGLALW
jgi:transposase InsO family protein